MKIINLIYHRMFNFIIMMLLTTTSISAFSSGYHPITIDNRTNYTITVYAPSVYSVCTYQPTQGNPVVITVGPGKKGTFTWEDKNSLSCFLSEKITGFKFITQDNKLLWSGRIGMIEVSPTILSDYYWTIFYSKQYCPARLNEISEKTDGAPPPSYIRAYFNSEPIKIDSLYDVYHNKIGDFKDSDQGWTITLLQPPEGTKLEYAGDPSQWTCWN
ncbi:MULTISPECIES: hypothetical protein [Xenorhabdus]|uniref:hypothetical protein n=1 Tax=Xenorhabdus TaxID=626 RepID=UPI001E5B0E42|nr:hypothetical protein [Xenorhabdus sp. PB30.3]MCC8381478.1 hypothetical protein [Xenorhabdus sp. PB30.3]